MTSLRRDQFTCTVLANIPLCREHFRLVLSVSEFPSTEPGQFIQIACRPVAGKSPGFDSPADVDIDVDWTPGQTITPIHRELGAPLAVLRRPFSLAGRRDTPAGVELDIIHRVVGIGTDWMSQLKNGDEVGILGPLGNRFELSAPGSTALLVGGGVGIPPMIYLAQQWAGRPAVVFSGALTTDLLPLTITEPSTGISDHVTPRMNVAEFARHGIPAVLATDDGSYGFQGFVTQALEAYLDQGAASVSARTGNATRSPSDTAAPPTIYTCGPEPMMKRVQTIAAARGLRCQIAVERAMACGMGTCQSCCIRVRKPDPAQPPLAGKEWCYRLACTDGPVFQGTDLLW